MVGVAIIAKKDGTVILNCELFSEGLLSEQSNPNTGPYLFQLGRCDILPCTFLSRCVCSAHSHKEPETRSCLGRSILAETTRLVSWRSASLALSGGLPKLPSATLSWLPHASPFSRPLLGFGDLFKRNSTKIFRLTTAANTGGYGQR